MGKCYCDYCDVFLTNDSVAVRKQHNEGNRHKYNVCEYYRQYVGQQLQQQIDDIVAQFELDVARGLLRPTYGLPPPSKTATDTLPTASAPAEAPNSSTDGPSPDGPSSDAHSPDSRADVNANKTDSDRAGVEPAATIDVEPHPPEKDLDTDVDPADSRSNDKKSANDKNVSIVHDPVSVNTTTESDGTEMPQIIPANVDVSANESKS